MLNSVDFYYFSPTGGTYKGASAIAYELAKYINEVNMFDQTITNSTSNVVVIAAPVFGGRILTIVREKIASLNGKGKKAITVVVYGVRAYEDALL